MSQVMREGFVYAVNDIDKLTKQSVKNVSKSHHEELDDGKIVFLTGKTHEGLMQYSPYDAINVGYVIEEKVPRDLLKQLAKGGRLVSPTP